MTMTRAHDDLCARCQHGLATVAWSMGAMSGRVCRACAAEWLTSAHAQPERRKRKRLPRRVSTPRRGSLTVVHFDHNEREDD